MKVLENTLHNHSACSCSHEHNEVKVKETNNHLHGVVCSLSCNHEEHERTGFSSTSYINFSKESIFDQSEDGIKEYIDQQATLFEAPIF